jgi:hypothetical protein
LPSMERSSSTPLVEVELILLNGSRPEGAAAKAAGFGDACCNHGGRHVGDARSRRPAQAAAP